jgi:predicted nucleotidyltransferase
MHENLVRIKAVNEVLKELEQEFVFVGGATVSLYATNPELASEVRPTDDVDVVVELASYGGYAAIDEKLRGLGFKNDMESGVICRYRLQGIIVDIMPTDPRVIGFANQWYPEGFETAIGFQLDEVTSVRIFSLPYFMASKWEAFKSRGKDDYRTSKDFEDLVYIWENVDDFEEQINLAPDHLKDYLKSEIGEVVHTDNFEEGLYSHLTGGYGGVDAGYIRAKLESALKFK